MDKKMDGRIVIWDTNRGAADSNWRWAIYGDGFQILPDWAKRDRNDCFACAMATAQKFDIKIKGVRIDENDAKKRGLDPLMFQGALS